MPQTNPTPMWRLANQQIKGGVDAFIDARREAEASWYDIALDIYLETKGAIKVTPATVRNWVLARDESAA